MASYTRQSSFSDGDTISASLFNNEYNQLVTAFSYASSGTTGHRHDGTTGEGGNIHTIGDQDFLNKIVVDSTNNRWGFYVQVSSSAVEQIRIQDGAIVPVTDSDIDLGTSSLEFKDLFIDGTASIDSLTLTSGATVTVIFDEDDMSSNSATGLATQQSIKAYVDSQVTGQSLSFSGDSGGSLSIDLDSEALTITGGTGIDTTGSTNDMSIAIDSTVATLTGSQTLTNKTLTAPVISSISNTGTITLPTSTDTLVGRATTDTLTNKTISSASNTITVNLGSATVTGTLAQFNSALSDGSFVSLTGSETLTNKTLTSPVITTPQINDTSANHQYVFAVSELAADRTVTLPLLAGNDTFVFQDHTQTLTNKTLTAPVISTISNSGTVTLPTGSTTLVGTGTSDVLTNKTISGSSNTLSNIGNSSLSNSSVSFGGISVSLGGSDATPAFDLSDATGYTGDSNLVTTGTITSGVWQGTAVADAYVANDLTISGGTVNNTVIGGTTAAAGTFTSLVADGGTIKLDGNYPTGTENVALGDTALDSVTSSGNYNTAIGAKALTANTDGGTNTAVGSRALDANSTGGSNTAVGQGALSSNETGSNNSAFGQGALGVVTGSSNLGLGAGAGNLLTTGSNNVIIGNYDGNEGGLDIRTSSNNIVLSDGAGNIRLHIDSAGAASFNGAVTAGGNLTVNGADVTITANIIHSGDTNTYFGFPSDDTFRIVTSGSEALRVDSSGNLGIGTVTPSEKLHVAGSATATSFVTTAGGTFTTASGNDLNIVYPSARSLFIKEGSETHVTVDNTGKVGIGSSTISGMLQVTGADTVEGDAKGQIVIKDSAAFNASPTMGIIFQGEHTSGSQAYMASIFGAKENTTDGNYAGFLGFATRAQGSTTAERMRIDSSGNVGIGTTSPSDALHVLDSSGNAYISVARGSQSQGEVGVRLRGGTSGNDWYIYQKTSSNNLNFYNTADRVTIDSSGNVGIGTSSPNVSSYDANASALTISGTNRGLLELRGATGANSTQLGAIRFLAGSTSEADIICELDSSGNGLLTFDTNGSERLRIDSNGKLLVGDSASHTSDLLQIETPASGGGHGIQIRRNDANGDQTIGTISFGNNTDTDLARISAKTDGDGNSGDSGALLFSTQPTSGSLTERMRITSSGNLQIAGTGTDNDSHAIAFTNGACAIARDNNDLELHAYSNMIFGVSASSYPTSTERMRIDSGGRVGIFNSSAVNYTGAGARSLVVGSNSSASDPHGITIVGGSSSTSNLAFTDNAGDGSANDYRGLFQYAHSDDSLRIFVASAERMRIDSNGRLLVGTTDTNVADNNAESSADNGLVFSTGALSVSKHADRALYLNRTQSDGAIAEFRINGLSCGSIGSISSDLYIAEGNSGLRFDGENNQILPCSTSASTDRTCNLGASSARFNDFYAGGNINHAIASGASGDTVISAITGVSNGYQITIDSSNNQTYKWHNATTQAMTLNSVGTLLLGQTTGTIFDQTSVTGFTAGANGTLQLAATGATVLYVNRIQEGQIVGIYEAGAAVGGISSYSDTIQFGQGNVYLQFANATDTIIPANGSGSGNDNAIDLGSSTVRFDDIFATNGTIQTSDRNEKQDIEALTDAEQRVAVACKGLLRKFRWKSAVTEKGDDARIHFGIIAQDLQAAFEAEGLDAGRYAMFINSTWTDEETGEERSRMGVRYSELLAFIIAAI